MYTLKKFFYSNVTQQEMLDDMQLRWNKHGNPYRGQLQNILIIWLLQKKCYEIYADRFPHHITVTFVNADNINCFALVTFKTKQLPANYILLETEKKMHLTNTLDENDWIIFNIHQVGKYKTINLL